MFLQLHDNGQAMASRRYPNTPDLILPDALKVSKREILQTAVEEGTKIAADALDKALKNAANKGDKNAILDELPTLDLENLDLEEIPEFDVTLVADRAMSGPWAVLLKVGAWLLKYGKIIYDFAMKAVRTVNLVQVNQRIQSSYDANEYNVQNLNELSPKQIDDQLKIMTGDYLNAVNDKNKVDTSALGRMIAGYQNRKMMLPAINQRTLLIGGGLLAAYLLFKK